MSRPLRIEFPDALYHVTSRGDRREAIFVDDVDRVAWLDVLSQACERMDVGVHAYCLMGNHYHLVVATRRPNLSVFMRQLNGVFTQRVNRRHGKVGHVFQGRFKAILVDRQAYFLEVCRYVELNPVRARMVPAPQDWPWSSYRAHTGLATAPDWLDVAAVASALLGEEARTSAQRRQAGQRYAALVAATPEGSLWDRALQREVFLGGDDFIAQVQALAPQAALRSPSVPRPQRTAPGGLAHWLATCPSRDEALERAHTEGGMTMTALAAELGISVGRVSQLIARAGRGSGLGGSD